METLDDVLKGAAQEHGKGGGDFFKFEKSGDYRLRLLSLPAAMATHFFGKGQPSSVCYGIGKGCPFHEDHEDPAVKFIAYVLDRSDNKIKLGEFPWSVVSALSAYQKDEEYAFASYPMPYDVKVTVDKENKDKKQIYKTIAGRAVTPLTEEQMADLHEKLDKMPVEKFIEKRKEAQITKHKETGLWVSDEKRAELDRARMAKAKEIAEADGTKDDAIEYPHEDINPDDIPF